MFTGIIQFTFLSKLITNTLFLFADEAFLKLISIGDSVAVNGVCLTVASIDCTFCTFILSQETLALCHFTKYENISSDGILSNIELPLKYGHYIGGHMVSGHVHQTAKFISLSSDGNMWLSFCNLKNIHHLQLKGSIAVNGVSLTIAEILYDEIIDETKIRIALIPETLQRTNLRLLQPDHFVNIEFELSHFPSHINSMSSAQLDEVYFMKKAIEEGNKGRTTAPPNPWVGCVIVQNNQIISSGYHKKCGAPHAEVNAIRTISYNSTYNSMLNNGPITLYVTLEPCCHHGRTPPCTDLLIEKKIAKVVVGILDPDENVSGKGLAKLRDAGIEVVLMEDIDIKTYNEIRYNLRDYIFHRTYKRPYVIAKIGLTFDNCYRNINPDEQWITHEESRKEGHILRSQSQAIIIGGATVQKDDPLLNIRYNILSDETHSSSNNPLLRVVIDGTSLTSMDRKLFNSNENSYDNLKTLVMTSENLLPKWTIRNEIDNNSYEIVTMSGSDKLDLHEVLQNLYQRKVMSCLVEGGGKLHYEFLQEKLVNELCIFKNPNVLGNKSYEWKLPAHVKLELIESRILHDENLQDNNKNIMERYLVSYCNDSFENIINENIIDEIAKTHSIEHAVNEFKKGNFVLVLDDESRENEGDLVVAASKITSSQMIEMINETTGIICCPMERNTAKKLNLPLMCENNTDIHKTAFTVSVDFVGTGTGVSSTDRLMTVNALGNPDSLPGHFRRPGHIFPLIAHPDGLKARQGHTEASVALCKLAQIYPRVAVIAELQNSNGKMKSRRECYDYATTNKIPIITVQQLVKHCENHSIEMLAECDIQSKIGSQPWKMMCFGNPSKPHKVFIYYSSNDKSNDITNKIVPVRIHSECFTGDVFRSQHCDCGEQLKYAQKYIVEQGHGIIIFPADHEGRGIGITHKVKAYKLQKEQTIDTFEANRALNLDDDARTYEDIREILHYLNITRIELLTENPDKVYALRDFIVTTKPIIIDDNAHNRHYLETKRVFFNNKFFNNKSLQPRVVIPKDHNPIIDLDKYDKSNIKDLNIAFVYSMWHSSYIEQIRNRLKEYFNQIGIDSIHEFDVPGSNEIPFKASQIALDQRIKYNGIVFDGIVCIGILVKGDTLHFENVSTAVSNGIMQAQISSGIPMMNCILSCQNMEQVIERIQGDKSTLEYIARSLVKMILG